MSEQAPETAQEQAQDQTQDQTQEPSQSHEQAQEPSREQAQEQAQSAVGPSLLDGVAPPIEPEVPGAGAALPKAPKPRRPFPWRWVGAVTVALAVGAGCAFGVMSVKRTDVPGLKTAADGRYDFAPLSLPTLAPGQTDPYDLGNVGGQHMSDIRKLLLPAPVGASADASLPGARGWVSEPATLKIDGGTSGRLAGDGWRHTAGVAWKTPDGADTKIYLAQFVDGPAAENASSQFEPDIGGANPSTTQSGTFDIGANVQMTYLKTVSGATSTWYGFAQCQDVDFVIVYKAPRSVGVAPFKQEADLQVELLQ